MSFSRHAMLIVTGGAAGVSMPHLLQRQQLELNVEILEPSSEHFYQPDWTLVGGGWIIIKQTRRSKVSRIPTGLSWIHAAGFDPDQLPADLRLREAGHLDQSGHIHRPLVELAEQRQAHRLAQQPEEPAAFLQQPGTGQRSGGTHA